MPDDPTASDAEWKRIQQNTFTRWCNEHLKVANLYIYNIEQDLSDGLKLIALLQVLSHKKIARYNKKPTFRPQKLENIAIALKFIEDENIKLVNIGKTHLISLSVCLHFLLCLLFLAFKWPHANLMQFSFNQWELSFESVIKDKDGRRFIMGVVIFFLYKKTREHLCVVIIKI